MKLLSNGCKRSEITVIPSNWKTTSTIRKPWMVYYRFYCPELTGPGTKYPKGKLMPIRGMNEFKSANERRDYVKGIIIAIERDLEQYDYNPITGYRKQLLEEKTDYEINPDAPLMDALQAAYEKRKVTTGVKKDLRSVLKYAAIAAKNLKLDKMPVKEVRRRHVKALLEQCGKVKIDLEDIRHRKALKNKQATVSELVKKEVWTANNFNFYRSHLSMLFDELCEWETIENNPVEKIKKEKHTVAKRKTLTPEQREAINDGLYKDNYRFWRLMHLFFDSGARESEMVLLKWEDVSLDQQEIVYSIFKGEYRREIRPISIDVIPLWREVMDEAKPGQFLFAKDLKPGKVSISSDNAFTRRWKRWVKNKENEQGEKKYGEALADIYSLKHSHSTEVAKRVGTKLAALHNQHTEAVLKQSYDVEGSDREMQILKGIRISFVPDQMKKPA